MYNEKQSIGRYVRHRFAYDGIKNSLHCMTHLLWITPVAFYISLFIGIVCLSIFIICLIHFMNIFNGSESYSRIEYDIDENYNKISNKISNKERARMVRLNRKARSLEKRRKEK